MKRSLIILVAAVAANMAVYAGAARAEEGTTGLGEYGAYAQPGQKDECLLVAMNCPSEDESVLRRVDRLRIEIEKGTDVYTPAELQNLKEQLEWIYTESDNLFLSR